MKFYNMKVNEVLSNLKSDLEGLTLEEAKKRLLADGHNKLVEQEKESNIQKFFNEFRNLMIVIWKLRKYSKMKVYQIFHICHRR